MLNYLLFVQHIHAVSVCPLNHQVSWQFSKLSFSAIVNAHPSDHTLFSLFMLHIHCPSFASSQNLTFQFKEESFPVQIFVIASFKMILVC